MNATWCIARREYLATVRTKGFLIGLILVPLLMFGGILVLVLVKDQRDTTDKRIALVDHSGVLAGPLVAAAEAHNRETVRDPRTGKKIAPAYLLEIVPPATEDAGAQQLALSDRVRSKELHAYLEIGPGVIHPQPDDANSRVSYHSPGAALDDLRGWLAGQIDAQLRRLRLEEAGVSEAQVPHLFDRVAVQPMSLVSADAATGRVQAAERHDEAQMVIGPFVLALVMYVMILMAALPMLHAVMEEKTQRIAEVLLGSARPFPLMFGKMLSALGVALTGAAVYLGLAILSGGYLAALAYVPWGLLPWFLAYLGPAILMYAALSAALGSACNDPKDAQNLTFPVILPVILPMFFLAPVIKEPQSTFATALSLFPPFTPVLMLLRLGHPAGAPWWQGLIGLAGLVLFASLTIWIAGRVFRVAFLIQGHSPRLKDLLRWAIKG